MTGEWIDQRSRDDAVRRVEDAWASGQLTEAERDRRVSALGRAESRSDVEEQVGDLLPVSYDRPRTPAPAPLATTLARPAVPARPTRRAALVVASVVVALAALTGVVVAASGGDDAAVSTEERYAPDVDPGPDGVNLFAPSSWRRMLADLADQRGDTTAFSAVLHPTYAEVDVPQDATTQRTDTYRWDGELHEPDSTGAVAEQRFELTAINHDVLIDLAVEARSRVEDADVWYAVVHAPSADGTVFEVHAGDGHDESVLITATGDGTITSASTQ